MVNRGAYNEGMGSRQINLVRGSVLHCPHCHSEIPMETISDATLNSEWGRRTAAMRKTFGGKGKLKFWRGHHPIGPKRYCNCWRCRWNRLEKIVESFVRTVKRNLDLTGAMPPRTWERWAKLQDMELRVLEARPKRVPL